MTVAVKLPLDVFTVTLLKPSEGVPEKGGTVGLGVGLAVGVGVGVLVGAGLGVSVGVGGICVGGGIEGAGEETKETDMVETDSSLWLFRKLNPNPEISKANIKGAI